jgi:hypothetical protein
MCKGTGDRRSPFQNTSFLDTKRFFTIIFEKNSPNYNDLIGLEYAVDIWRNIIYGNHYNSFESESDSE